MWSEVTYGGVGEGLPNRGAPAYVGSIEYAHKSETNIKTKFHSLVDCALVFGHLALRSKHGLTNKTNIVYVGQISVGDA